MIKRLFAAAETVIILGTALWACADRQSPEYCYDRAVRLMEQGDYDAAIAGFDALNGYQDSAELRRQACLQKIRTGSVCVGDTVAFGDYKGHTAWRVLAVSGSEAYLTTTAAVENRMFDFSGSYWESSAIRSWLNDQFLNEAFNEDERGIIVSRNGDSICLLSIEEAYRYFRDDEDRFLETDDETNMGYWLRNTGRFSDHASCVDGDTWLKGNISEYGGLVYMPRGVRPAVRIRFGEASAEATAEQETVSESGDYILTQSGGQTDLTGLTEAGKTQEHLVIPAGVSIFGSVAKGRAKTVTFESDDDIDYGFLLAGSITLETVALPARLTKLGRHSNCPHLKELLIPEGVREIPVSCFEYDESLERVIFKGNVTEIPAQAFFVCESLREISLPDSVTSIGPYAFASCTALQEITLPKNLKKIGEYAFEDSGIRLVTVPAETELTEWKNAFAQSERPYMPMQEREYTVRVKKDSWADRHFDEVFVGKVTKEYI